MQKVQKFIFQTETGIWFVLPRASVSKKSCLVQKAWKML